MIEGIDHVNLVVRDLNAMIAFYRDVLGFLVTKEATISGDWIAEVVGLKDVLADVVYLHPSQGPRVELIHYRQPEGFRPDGLSLANTFGLRHIAFRVTDVDRVVDRLRLVGVRTHSPVATVPQTQVTYAGGASKKLVYFQDPEGNLLELCEYPLPSV
jgi:catechol 2,3-dioxygenase-like lactoylglutathione lyase family enzyme